MRVTAGVPQGSVLEPTLWNVLYDGVLRLKLTEGCSTIGFADDLAIMIEATDEEELTFRANGSLWRINSWMESHYLEIVPEKKEAVILKGPRKRGGRNFQLKDVPITPVRAVRYLGIMLDDNGKFGPHIDSVTKNAEKRAAMLARIMPNIGGSVPQSQKRLILSSAMQSILLYGAPLWYKSMKVASTRGKMERVQKKMLLRVGSAYRTVSTKAIQVWPPPPPQWNC